MRRIYPRRRNGETLLIVGVLLFLGSLAGMLKIKPEEGRTAMKPGPGAMKLIGAFVAALGWVITLFGMHLTPSVGGTNHHLACRNSRESFGMIVVLPAAFNKNAVWKS